MTIASPAGNGNPDPTLNLNHVVIKYAQTGVPDQPVPRHLCATTFADIAGDGIDVRFAQRGTDRVGQHGDASNVAINIQSASVDMGALNGNSGSGNG